MTAEAQIRPYLQIKKVDPTTGIVIIDFIGRPTSFRADVGGNRGPFVGEVIATTTGTDVDLSALTTPGLCWIYNQDPTNPVEIGPYDPDVTTYLPLLELLPGEAFPFRLSRYLGSEMGNVAGTGTSGQGVKLRLKGVGGSVSVLVQVFEK